LTNGIDGPYYLVQTLYIEKYGTMYHGDPPLTFYILYAFYKLLGDPTLAVKIGIMLFTSLTTIPLYLYFYNTTSRAEVGFSASIAPFSPHIVRLMGDFVKTTFRLFFLALPKLRLHEIIVYNGIFVQFKENYASTLSNEI